MRKQTCAVLTALALLQGTDASYSQPVRFAVIGDYGWSGQPEADVATMVRGWDPDFVITTGDNNYDFGAASTIDQNIGQYYHQFISPYTGSYGQGDTVNRFFPSIGNHDWIADGALPYLNYFTLPGNELYYDTVIGNVHLFSIDSDPHEPDGITSSSTQGQWLQSRLASSTARWKIVYFHHPPYSSGAVHGSSTYMRWPFRQWGASAVLSGHEHDYERVIIDGLPFLVNGLGGRSIYNFGTPISGSAVRYNADYGAQLVTADDDSMVFAFYSRTNTLVDRYVIRSNSRYAVQDGWNMISLPLTVIDPRKAVVFPSASSSALAFDQGAGYVAHDTLRYGEGYWLRFSTTEDVIIDGVARAQDSVAVEVGWNLIGTISDSVQVSSVQQHPPAIITSPFYGYNAGYFQSTMLLPSRGYWVRADAPGVLVLASTGLRP